MIRIVDYGVGNIQAFLSAFNILGIPALAAKSASDFADADKLILPGVGAFDVAINMLEKSGMRKILEELVLVRQIPVLGVCVGMQILGLGSEEGDKLGLNWVSGKVRALQSNIQTQVLPIPHMGWNDIKVVKPSSLFLGLESNAKFYFLHSYYFECENSNNFLATTSYGLNYCCALNYKNIYGVQFHPEKSHNYGMKLLKNFSDI